MRAFDILSFILTALGTSAVFLSLRLLLPCYVIQYVEARLEKTEEHLNQAEAENAIPSESEYRDRFMRMASNQSPRFLEQVWLASMSCLTYKLYALYSRIGALQRDLETAIDQHQHNLLQAAYAPEALVVSVSGPISPPPAARSLAYPPTRMDISQMWVDQHQLASVLSEQRDAVFHQNSMAVALPVAGANTTTPTIQAAGPTLPLPAVVLPTPPV